MTTGGESIRSIEKVQAAGAQVIFLQKVEMVCSRAMVDFALRGLLGSASRSEDVHSLLDVGAVGLKAFLGYAIRRSNRQVVYTPDTAAPDLEALAGYDAGALLAPDLGRRGAPLAVHCEDADILRTGGRARPRGGRRRQPAPAGRAVHALFRKSDLPISSARDL